MDKLAYYGLETNPDIEFIEYSSDEEWLEERKKGIGGSDAAAVLGLSKYKSPLQLYKIKEGELSEDLSENVYIRKGKDLEALIRNVYVKSFVEELGYRLCHPNSIIVNKSIPWLRANCDGIAIPINHPFTHADNLIIEIKWVSEWGESNWYGDDYCGVPPEYYAQVQHYMLVTGAKNAYVCAMFDKGWKFETFHIPFDISFAKRLEKETKEFYEYHMCMHIPPKPNPDLDKEDFAAMLTETACVSVAYSDSFEALVENYLLTKQEADSLAKNAEATLANIKSLYATGFRSKKHHVSIDTRSVKRFDTSKFAADHPELYVQYLKNGTTTYTTIKK